MSKHQEIVKQLMKRSKVKAEVERIEQDEGVRVDGKLKAPLSVRYDSVNPTIRLVEGKYPEPWFTETFRAVFSDVQTESPELAHMLAREQEWAAQRIDSPPPSSPMLRFGAFMGDELIGWSCGWFERSSVFHMATSGVLAQYRRCGVYSALLDAVISHAESRRVNVVRSNHSVLNNAVIICKLKRGFQITGLSISAQMGTLVELTLHLSPSRKELFSTRSIPLIAPL